MNKNIIYFIVKTNNNKYEYNNTTLDAIRADLKARMPKLTDMAIDKLFSNPNNFVKPKVEVKVKKNGYRPCLATLPTNGFDAYKEIFKLANTLYAYHKNGYRQWGTIVNEIFDDGRIQPYFSAFDKAFENVYHNINNEEVLNNAIISLIERMGEFYTKMVNHSTLKEYSDFEFINGDERRLGMKTILERIPMVIHLKKVC